MSGRFMGSALLRRAGHALVYLGAAWLLLVGLVVVYSAVAGATWPSFWRAPWSGGLDFVVLEDGRLAVYISFYDRLELYSSAGVYEGAWKRVKGYLGGEGRLSLAEDGRLFVTASHGRLRGYSADGKLIRKRTAPGALRAWRLGPTGEPVAVDGPGTPERTRPVRPGEILIAGHPAPKRTEFVGHRGLRATRSGARIDLQRADGEKVTVRTPWLLWPVKLPWPAVLPLVLLLAASALDQLRARRRGS